MLHCVREKKMAEQLYEVARVDHTLRVKACLKIQETCPALYYLGPFLESRS